MATNCNVTNPCPPAFPPPTPPAPPTPVTPVIPNGGGGGQGGHGGQDPITQTTNDFGLGYELFNTLRWGPAPTVVAGYYVYRDGVRIATLSDSTYEYEDHNRPEGVTTFYTVTSFSSSGAESTPINFEIN